MTKRSDFPEKRKHKRFNVKGGILAVSSPDHSRVGQIKDVSKGGLAFQYLADARSTEEPLEVEMFSTVDAFSLELPVKKVVDFKIDTKGIYNALLTRQLSFQFVKLNHSQELLLDHFIQRYTHK
jgi:hypothetical protein